MWELDLMQEAGIYNNMNFHKAILIQTSSNESGGNLWPIIQLMQWENEQSYSRQMLILSPDAYGKGA